MAASPLSWHVYGTACSARELIIPELLSTSDWWELVDQNSSSSLLLTDKSLMHGLEFFNVKLLFITYLWIDKYVCVCTCICIYLCMYDYMYICMGIYINIHMNTCIIHIIFILFIMLLNRLCCYISDLGGNSIF